MAADREMRRQTMSLASVPEGDQVETVAPGKVCTPALAFNHGPTLHRLIVGGGGARIFQSFNTRPKPINQSTLAQQLLGMRLGASDRLWLHHTTRRPEAEALLRSVAATGKDGVFLVRSKKVRVLPPELSLGKTPRVYNAA
jgi:hypothetical protein